MDIPAHSAFQQMAGMTVHLGVTGSVAAFKSLELLRMLQEVGIRATACITESGQRFVTPLSMSALGAELVDQTLFDPSRDNYAHLRPGMEADAFIIAPATANILAKAAHGLADDILSCQVLSYPRSILFAPAMNSRMLDAAPTQDNLELLRKRGHTILDAASGSLACGEIGSGRLAEPRELLLATLKSLAPQDMDGMKVMVTLGRTEEAWDSVRRWTNPSSGKMGGAIAIAAWLRGAEVHAIQGPGDVYLPMGIHRHDIKTAQELFEAASSLWPDMDVACCVAAVCDFRPKPFEQGKFKKSQASQGLSIEFLQNPDTLAYLGASKSESQILIGFAAETEGLEDQLASKLTAKNTDLMVGNIIGRPDTGFAASDNQVTVLDANGRKEAWPVLAKTEIAWRIWDWLATL